MGPEYGYMWTHRNGNSPGAAVQQIDFLYCTPEMVNELRDVAGGVRDFPGAWDVSDHAPIIAEFFSHSAVSRARASIVHGTP